MILPCLGFVLDPMINLEQHRRERGDPKISELGSYLPPAPRQLRTAKELRIGILGGSVAFLFSFTARQRLIEEISRLADTRGRRVAVDCFALGGNKQPRQLMPLAYLPALGERFDVVINLDGFNEMALTMAGTFRPVCIRAIRGAGSDASRVCPTPSRMRLRRRSSRRRRRASGVRYATLARCCARA